MAGINYEFNAHQYEPRQGAGPHPVGDFPAVIAATRIDPTKDGTGGIFVVEFETSHGNLTKRYNLWNASAKASEIAHHELSALCFATGMFNVSMSNEGAALRGMRCMIRVGLQKGEEAEQKGYVEIKKVLAPDGSEPGKGPVAPAPAPAPAPAFAQPPAAQAPAGPWGGQPASQTPAGPWGAPAADAAPAAPPWGAR